jgi:ABC-type multidrug transport system ATPase subunit
VGAETTFSLPNAGRDPAERPLRIRPEIEAVEVTREFRGALVLDGVSLDVAPGEIHALLGPNGAGKTTLLRILAGIARPTSGSLRVAGLDPAANPHELRRLLGVVPAGDRSFYLRISGLENLVFFARLHGMTRRAATARAHQVMAEVGLAEAARKQLGLYSHGMQKRVSIARALLTKPRVLLVDEATHDLDPEGARRVRELIERAAGDGTAVLWATQRLDEIRGFADGVTLIDRGRTRFRGSVHALLEHAVPRRYVFQLRNGRLMGRELEREIEGLLAPFGRVTAAGPEGSDHFLVSLAHDAVLGEVVATLAAASVQVLACRQEQSEIEEAFLALTAEERQ